MTQGIYFIGVDLGTVTNQAADINEAGRAQPIRLADGDTSMLAVVYFDANDNPVFGQEAENLRLLEPSRGVELAKRHMGTSDAVITVGGKPYTAEDIATLQLTHIKDHIEKERNRLVEGAVVTVPANCEDAAKAAVINAAKRAGFREVTLKHRGPRRPAERSRQEDRGRALPVRRRRRGHDRLHPARAAWRRHHRQGDARGQPARRRRLHG